MQPSSVSKWNIRIMALLLVMIMWTTALPIYAANQHECFTKGCTRMVPIGTSYCDKHRCAVSWGCNSPKRPSSDYCGDHTCQTSDCHKVVVKYTKHCKSHQTDKDRETVKKYQEVESLSSKSNTSKTCSVSGCSNKRTSGSAYCSTHTCKKSGCTSWAVSKGYCYKHRNSASSGSSSGKSSSKKKSSNYDDYYEDDPEAYYSDNKNLYRSFDEAMDDWEDEYGDDY